MKVVNFSCFILLAVFVEKCYCCSPPLEPSHPQTRFCQAKYAIKVKVLKQVKSEDKFEHKYKVRVQRIFKNDTGANILRRRGIQYLYTPSDQARCGSYLIPKTPYLVTGTYNSFNNRLEFNSFNWVVRWRYVTKAQRRGVKKRYQCECTIARCENGQCEEDDLSAGCYWAPGFSNDCWAKNGICMNKRNKCEWSRYTRKECGEVSVYGVGTPVTMINPVTMP